MSGPVSTDDAAAGGGTTGAIAAAAVEVLEGRPTSVGGMPVVRVLPKRQRRTIGAWCFVDHFGPSAVATASMQVGPHPHIGLQTVTWVLDGEVLHTDSLGSEHGIVVVEGAVAAAGARSGPGRLVHLGPGMDEVAVEPLGGEARLLLLGGPPFGEEIVMWWNFVARSTDELDSAYRDWSAGDGRFGSVRSALVRIDAPRPHWRPLT